MTVLYFFLCTLFVVFLISFLLHCLQLYLDKESDNNLMENMNQYKNTVAGALENDRVNEREEKKTQ